MWTKKALKIRFFLVLLLVIVQKFLAKKVKNLKKGFLDWNNLPNFKLSNFWSFYEEVDFYIACINSDRLFYK